MTRILFLSRTPNSKKPEQSITLENIRITDTVVVFDTAKMTDVLRLKIKQQPEH